MRLNVQARIERRRAEEAAAVQELQALEREFQIQEEDRLPGDGDLWWVGLAIVVGCAVSWLGLAWLATALAGGRF